MRLYLRRLWAALGGRQHLPLRMGEGITFLSPGGAVFRAEITRVEFSDALSQPATLQITATTANWRRRAD